MTALFLLVVMGAMALVIDFGRVALEKPRIQNGADAAALAGALSLPISNTKAQTDAATWANNNVVTGAEITGNVVSSVDQPNDTITVDVRRTVTYSVAQVLSPFGMPTSVNVTASAAAQIKPINGVIAGEHAYPWAVWDGNTQKKKVGDSVIFRSNDYSAANVEAAKDCTKTGNPGCTWNIQSNSFKGYFHWKNGSNYYASPTNQAFSEGGNAFGASDEDDLNDDYVAGRPVLLPVISKAAGNGGDLDFVIPSFVCVRITQMSKGGAQDWIGTIVKCISPGLTDGGTAPSINSAYTPKLVH